MIKLTKSERLILEAIWAAPDKVAQHTDLTKAAGVTGRGGTRIRERMVDRTLISRLPAAQYTITYKGMRALGVSK